MKRRSLRIALVSSVGGHLAEMLEVLPALQGHEVFWVVNDASPVLPAGAEIYRISHAERDWRVLWNVIEVARIFADRQPDLMISMGAGPAVSAAIVARAIGIEVIYVEPSSAVTEPTLTGRLMRHFTRRLYVQWPSLEGRLRGSRFAGGLL